MLHSTLSGEGCLHTRIMSKSGLVAVWKQSTRQRAAGQQNEIGSARGAILLVPIGGEWAWSAGDEIPVELAEGCCRAAGHLFVGLRSAGTATLDACKPLHADEAEIFPRHHE